MGEVRESYLGVSELNQVKVNDTDLAEIFTSNFDVQMELVFELIFKDDGLFFYQNDIIFCMRTSCKFVNLRFRVPTSLIISEPKNKNQK